MNITHFIRVVYAESTRVDYYSVNQIVSVRRYNDDYGLTKVQMSNGETFVVHAHLEHIVNLLYEWPEDTPSTQLTAYEPEIEVDRLGA